MGMFNQPVDQIKNEDVVEEVFNIHDTVYFVGGGPPMTIININHSTPKEQEVTPTIVWVTVAYYDHNLVFRREMFDIYHLSHGDDMEDDS